MKHLSAINKKAARVVAATEADVVALQQGGGTPQQPEQPHIPPGCSLVFSPGWEVDTPAAPPGCARRWSATCSTATWAASGRPTCPISSTTPPTGRPSARRPRRTGARSTWCSPDEDCSCAVTGRRGRRPPLAVVLAPAARARAGAKAPDAHRRQRHDVHRHLQGRDRDLRRGHREDGGQDRAEDRDPALDHPVARPDALLRARTRGSRRSRSSTSPRARPSTASS